MATLSVHVLLIDFVDTRQINNAFVDDAIFVLNEIISERSNESN
jgi:hypothetical protein